MYVREKIAVNVFCYTSINDAQVNGNLTKDVLINDVVCVFFDNSA